jgi:hypothetical protein
MVNEQYGRASCIGNTDERIQQTPHMLISLDVTFTGVGGERVHYHERYRTDLNHNCKHEWIREYRLAAVGIDADPTAVRACRLKPRLDGVRSAIFRGE